ncbi:MAG TPA: MmcQ/YjbR family DNA-binding protein [Actinomycetes bacterium]
MAAQQEAEELFERIAERYLDQPAVSRGTGFGSSAGLRVGGKIFAMLDREGRLVLKLPTARVEELIDAGTGGRFEPRRDGRLMREWVTVPVSGRSEWEGLVDQAFQFVSSGSARTRRA